MYNEIYCGFGIGVDCLLSQGEIITVESDSITTVNFSLDKKPGFRINYRDTASGVTIPSTVKLFDSTHNQIYGGTSYSNAPSHIVESLQSGEYYIMAQGTNTDEHSIVGYPDVPCTDISSTTSCEVPLSPITLAINDGLKEINLGTYQKLGINGYVRDESSQEVIGNVVLDIWDSIGAIIASTTTSDQGGFSYNLSSGNYYITTDTNNAYTNEVYKDILCVNAAILGQCDVTQGELINIPVNNIVPVVIDIELEIDPIFSNGFN